MREQFNELLQKEMDRKDFLKHAGVAILALFGVSTILRTLNDVGESTNRQTSSSMSFGSGVYGGVHKK